MLAPGSCLSYRAVGSCNRAAKSAWRFGWLVSILRRANPHGCLASPLVERLGELNSVLTEGGILLRPA